jgi:hypothetical protein
MNSITPSMLITLVTLALFFITAALALVTKQRWLFFMTIALCILCMLTGCGTEHVVVKPQTEYVAKYYRAPLPEKLTRPCTYVEPDAVCWREGKREFCDEQLLDMRYGYRKALADCNDDKTGLRALQPEPRP